MSKHPNPSINKYDHGIAAYPLSFKTYVVSEKKICIQFEGVQCKARPVGNQDDMERGPDGTKQIEINTRGTEIGTLAVGIPLDMYPELLQNIERALKENEEKYGTITNR